MLSRLNAPSEVSLLPTGLGNHYVSSNKHLIPPGRRRLPYNHSLTSICYGGDPSAPEANTSFREEQEYFGPDVLVIIGLVLACLGGVLTLVSFYCEFRHPAIQATMAGIGPSLVGIGMLFSVLRLFFCSFCISETCCECIADGLRFLLLRFPCCCRCFRRSKKKVHPFQLKDVNSVKAAFNGTVISNGGPAASANGGPAASANGGPAASANGHITRAAEPGDVIPWSLQATPSQMKPITEEHESPNRDIVQVKINSKADHEMISKDELAFLRELDSTESGSLNSLRSLNKNISDLVLNSRTRY